MTIEKFKDACYRAVEQMRTASPRDTGNLADRAITIEFIGDNTCEIYVDDAIAPYVPYTNEEWISPRWNGKKNPNQGWIDNAFENILNTIASENNGEVGRK